MIALYSLIRSGRNLVTIFTQRSPPSLLTTSACGGLRSTPDCRPRRTFLHLSYSYAPPCGPALLVTQRPIRDMGGSFFCDAQPLLSPDDMLGCGPRPGDEAHEAAGGYRPARRRSSRLA